MKAPETVLASNLGLITAVIELEGGHLVSILDVGRFWPMPSAKRSSSMSHRCALPRTSAFFFVDDSIVAARSLKCSTTASSTTCNQRLEAWTRLQAVQPTRRRWNAHPG